jgi:hypothetical protein
LLVVTALCIAVIFAFVVLLARWVANGIRNAVSDAAPQTELWRTHRSRNTRRAVRAM